MRRTLAVVALCALAACGGRDENLLQGYIEGDFVYVSSPYAGRLEKLAVQRGTTVKAGEALFSLDDAPERAARDEMQRRRAQALASLADARKGRRPSELESLRAHWMRLPEAKATPELIDCLRQLMADYRASR